MVIPVFARPEYGETAFNCPFCGAYAAQDWSDLFHKVSNNFWPELGGWSAASCNHCSQISVWHEQEMLYPFGGSAPYPNPDLSDDLKKDYEEARAIANISPRGAAALLRLLIQKLCIELGEPGKRINDDIASLVKKGLPAGVQQALDSVRVIGNEAVHPGSIDLNDDSNIVSSLFGLVNFIAEKMLTEPKEIEEIYRSLPANKVKEIDKRDSNL